MKAVLYDFKTAKEEWFDLVVNAYTKKINPFMPFEVISLKSAKTERDDAQSKKVQESKDILKKMTNDDYVVLFDEKGKGLNSLQFSKQIEAAQMSGKKRLVFIVGGAYGVSDEIKSRAQIKVSLSNLVMNHLVAETVALEQIYRAFTIIKRIPYHNV